MPIHVGNPTSKGGDLLARGGKARNAPTPNETLEYVHISPNYYKKSRASNYKIVLWFQSRA